MYINDISAVTGHVSARMTLDRPGLHALSE